MKEHEFAGIIPAMTEEEYRSLVQGIKEQGFYKDKPIILFEDKILDGRHRYRACQELKIEPKFETYTGKDPLGYVVAANINRRQLTPTQKATIALDLLPYLEKEAKKRMALGGGDKRAGSQKIDYPVEDQGKSTEKAAKMTGANRQYVSDAKKIKAEDPKAFEELKKGTKTITEVKRKHKEEKREQRRTENKKLVENTKDVLSGDVKYSTIVIDPPWDWGDEGDVDQLGRAKPTYATMSIEEIKKLPIAKISDKDCHLYLWITNRSLPKGFDLLKEWGFRYVTMLTWCKPSIGMGNYFRGSTEQILFGIKGSQMLKRKDVGTWFAAKRGKHSEKPDELYQLVESCSYGPYLEMFARKTRPGWSSWGAEVK